MRGLVLLRRLQQAGPRMGALLRRPKVGLIRGTAVAVGGLPEVCMLPGDLRYPVRSAIAAPGGVLLRCPLRRLPRSHSLGGRAMKRGAVSASVRRWSLSNA
jgi:hypothetical protein